MKKVYIVDHDLTDAKLLAQYVAVQPDLMLVGISHNLTAAWHNLVTDQFAVDILLLEAQTPLLDEQKFAVLVKGTMQIVFVSHSTHYAPLAFDYNMADFLMKPISQVRFLQAIEKLRQQELLRQLLLTQVNRIALPLGGKGQLTIVDVEEITYLTSASNHVHVHFKNRRPLKYHNQLYEMEERLLSHNFMRIHRSYLININQIERIEGNTVRMARGGLAQLAKNKREEFWQRIGHKTKY